MKDPRCSCSPALRSARARPVGAPGWASTSGWSSGGASSNEGARSSRQASRPSPMSTGRSEGLRVHEDRDGRPRSAAPRRRATATRRPPAGRRTKGRPGRTLGVGHRRDERGLPDRRLRRAPLHADHIRHRGEVGRGGRFGRAAGHGDRHRPTLDQRRAARGILCDHGSRLPVRPHEDRREGEPRVVQRRDAACRSRPITDGTTSNWYEDGWCTPRASARRRRNWITSISPGGVYGFARHPG